LAVVGKQIAGVVKEKQANDALGGLRKERTRKRGLYHKLTQDPATEPGMPEEL
ncbi:MAG: hypothetical protein RJA59_2202, partial [Pseudomonadota bacterium]